MIDVTFTILGMYRQDSTIFNNMALPDMSAINITKQDVIDNILLETGELEILYTTPDMMNFAISVWSRKQLYTWKKLYDTLLLEYNPLESSYRTEHRVTTDNNTRDSSNNINKTDTINDTGSNNRTVQLDETGEIDTNNTENIDITKTNLNTRNLAASLDSNVNNTSSSNSQQDTIGNQHTIATEGIDQTLNTNTTKDGYAFNNAVAQDLGHSVTTETTDNQRSGDTNIDTTNVETLHVNNTSSDDTHQDTTDTGTISDSGDESHNTSLNGKVESTKNANTSDKTVIENERLDVLEQSENGNVQENNNSDMWFNLHGSGENNTPQQMINEEREVAKFDFLGYIINDFKTRFCLLVY